MEFHNARLVVAEELLLHPVYCQISLVHLGPVQCQEDSSPSTDHLGQCFGGCGAKVAVLHNQEHVSCPVCQFRKVLFQDVLEVCVMVLSESVL